MELRYKADITAGSLKIPESRLIADLLLREVNTKGWKDAIVTKNVLQARNPATAIRLTRLIRGRLETMGPELWKLIRDGKGTVAIHAAFAVAVKHSHLLGDFMNKVIREHLRNFEPCLSVTDWRKFLVDCEQRAPEVGLWAETTKKKLGQVVIRCLAEAKYLDNTRSMRITPVSVIPEVLRCLEQHGETYTLDCMTLNA